MARGCSAADRSSGDRSGGDSSAAADPIPGGPERCRFRPAPAAQPAWRSPDRRKAEGGDEQAYCDCRSHDHGRAPRCAIRQAGAATAEPTLDAAFMNLRGFASPPKCSRVEASGLYSRDREPAAHRQLTYPRGGSLSSRRVGTRKARRTARSMSRSTANRARISASEDQGRSSGLFIPVAAGCTARSRLLAGPRESNMRKGDRMRAFGASQAPAANIR